MNRRSARNRHRRIVPWTGVTRIVAPNISTAEHIRRAREFLQPAGGPRSSTVAATSKPRSSTIAAALLLASLGGGR